MVLQVVMGILAWLWRYIGKIVCLLSFRFWLLNAWILSDMWAVGAILAELYTSCPIFPGERWSHDLVLNISMSNDCIGFHLPKSFLIHEQWNWSTVQDSLCTWCTRVEYVPWGHKYFSISWYYLFRCEFPWILPLSSIWSLRFCCCIFLTDFDVNLVRSSRLIFLILFQMPAWKQLT